MHSLFLKLVGNDGKSCFTLDDNECYWFNSLVNFDVDMLTHN